MATEKEFPRSISSLGNLRAGSSFSSKEQQNVSDKTNVKKMFFINFAQEGKKS
jgi:hypothetical protein